MAKTPRRRKLLYDQRPTSAQGGLVVSAQVSGVVVGRRRRRSGAADLRLLTVNSGLVVCEKNMFRQCDDRCTIVPPHFYTARACLKLLFSAMWQTSQRWRRVTMTELEQQQLAQF